MTNNRIKASESSLTLHDSKEVVDFSNFPKLEYLNLSWNKHFINIEKCSQLKELTLWNYPDENLLLLKSFPELEKLSIYDAKIKNLVGIEHCQKLTSMILVRNRNLENIDLLTTVCETLTELVRIENSRKLVDYNVIGKLRNLKNLYLLNCGATPNINFVENLNALIYGSIDIDIIDGQVGVLLERPIIFKNYKHFTHKNTLKIKITNEGNMLIRTCAPNVKPLTITVNPNNPEKIK